MVGKIKLSDYVANFLAQQEIKKVFAISGGASLHLIHSVADHPGIDYICTHHEQGASMAADGYSRCSGNIGVAMATSGPGATNLITGICCSYYDSVPLLLITGQVSTFRMTADTGVRQIGFQETPIQSIVKEITKYSVQISNPMDIRYELEKALFIAKSERPGPVLIDIPDNLQRELIDSSQLRSYFKDIRNKEEISYPSFIDVKEEFIKYINESQRPIIIAGWGIHLSKTEEQFIELIETLNIPVALTWGASDLIPFDHKLYVGTFGTHGMRHANFAVQNADLILSFGSRLDTKSTGSPINTFAREARKIVVDIDPSELKKFNKFGLSMDLLIQQDLRDIFPQIYNNIDSISLTGNKKWLGKIEFWNENLNIEEKISCPDGYIDPYKFFNILSNLVKNDSNFFIDTGCSIAWSMQVLRIKPEQRVFHDFNNTAMGWALPASIGGYFADSKKNLICIIGDGSFMMTLQELATIKHHAIPIKIILINNSGYSMIKQTQDQWLSSNYVASSVEGGLSFPVYENIAKAFSLNYIQINNNNELENDLKLALNNEGPSLINVIVPPEARVIPQVKFGRPNEDMEPLLPRSIFIKEMITKPLEVSE
tara:strand:- start:924 stop:2723 length:1800 start_codon:yes stop_codon:yes gene_type:complete